MYRTITNCRACGYGPTPSPGGIKSAESNQHLLPVLSLGLQPLANDFWRPGETQSGFAPLEVVLCPSCELGQLSVVVDPAVLYRNYKYVTSDSATMRQHFERLSSIFYSYKPAGSVLEIGSNDGRFLSFLESRGFNCVGIDPAENLCATARAAGLKVVCDFFPTSQPIETPDIIIARHVFCHTDDWRGFCDCAARIAGPDTLVFIEVPHAADMISRGEFDTIYHEHASYFSLKAMQHLLRSSDLKLFDVMHFDIHGGALLVVLKKGDQPKPSVAEFLSSEKCGLGDWQDFADRTNAKIEELRALVHKLTAGGNRVAGYGASAKSTVWANACQFSRQDIAFITDTTPEKLWRMVPGTNIPVVDPGALLRELPEYTVLFAWNYAEEILKKEAAYLAAGGHFIIPHPAVTVVP